MGVGLRVSSAQPYCGSVGGKTCLYFRSVALRASALCDVICRSLPRLCTVVFAFLPSSGRVYSAAKNSNGKGGKSRRKADEKQTNRHCFVPCCISCWQRVRLYLVIHVLFTLHCCETVHENLLQSALYAGDLVWQT